MSAKSENIKVVVRCRPLNKKEKEKGYKQVVKVDTQRGIVQLYKGPEDTDPKSFGFNSAYPPDVTQQFIYDDCARPIVDAVLEGFNGTLFAYGQTGTGKTYTMEGIVDSEKDKGIILHAFDHIFAHISSVKDREFLVRASFLQIYMEDVFDLLGDPKKKLHVRQLNDDVSVVGLSSHIVKNPEEITKLLMAGKLNRATGATAMNQESSRSHSVFTIIVEQSSEERGTRMGKLHLVDLAGSERLGKTEATGDRAKEGAKINQSLLELGNVISALVTGKKHVSYRNSKLTQILQDSLGGNSKTCMIATLGPASYNYDETNSTLLYATRAKDIKNAPRINEDPKDALLGQLRDRIAELKKQLEAQQANAGINGLDNNSELKEIEEKHKKQLEELMAKKNVNEEERQKAKQALNEEYERQKKIREESQGLKDKIKQMEESVLVGGENLVDKAKQQEEEIRAHESKIRRQQEEQRRLEEKKKQQEEQILLVEKKYTSMSQELTEKSEKIEKLKPLIKHLEESIDDIQQQFEREKEEQTKHIYEMNKELVLLQLIAEKFIPKPQLEAVTKSLGYDESEQKVVVPHQELAGRHHVVEKEEEVNNIFIQGLDGPMDIMKKENPVAAIAKEERQKGKKKRQMAVHHVISEMGLIATNFMK